MYRVPRYTIPLGVFTNKALCEEEDAQEIMHEQQHKHQNAPASRDTPPCRPSESGHGEHAQLPDVPPQRVGTRRGELAFIAKGVRAAAANTARCGHDEAGGARGRSLAAARLLNLKLALAESTKERLVKLAPAEHGRARLAKLALSEQTRAKLALHAEHNCLQRGDFGFA